MAHLLSSADPEVSGVRIGRPDKLLWPDDGITKLDLATYYAEVSSVMLRHAAGRPIVMERYPDGIAADSFYERNVPSHFPEWVESAGIDTAEGRQRHVVVDDVRTLVYLADQACVTPHPWLSTAENLERPDLMVLDLDPAGDPAGSPQTLRAVRRATRLAGELLDDLGLTPFLKTSGSRGYHVVVPLHPEEDFDEVRDFARACATHLTEREPDLLTVQQRKDRRGGRVFVDWLRNGYGQSMAAAYAVRGRPGAPVSTPLDWEELARVEPTRHGVRSLPRRLAQRDDPWAGMGRHATALDRARHRLASREA